jgi:hypothetical protein
MGEGPEFAGLRESGGSRQADQNEFTHGKGIIHWLAGRIEAIDATPPQIARLRHSCAAFR